MTMEIPVLRLGLAGCTEAQHSKASEAAAAAGNVRASWEVGPFAEADAWWLEGSHTLLMQNQHLRVQPAVPTGRSVQLALADVDRPVAFTLPLTAPGFRPALTFDLDDKAAAVRVLERFTDLLQVMLSQFALASSMNQNQPNLVAGSWEVLRGSELLAVVDLKLGAGILPGVTSEDFAAASWCIRDRGAVVVPHQFPRTSVSQLMWQYAQRTALDLLPPHYRRNKLFFRRPPRLPQRQLRDAHLLLVRELAMQPGMTFSELQQSTGLADATLARFLSALYVVGSITANPKRANGAAAVVSGAGESGPPSDLSAFPGSMQESVLPGQRPRPLDMTAPLPLMPELR